jgi:hypothetical protein
MKDMKYTKERKGFDTFLLQSKSDLGSMSPRRTNSLCTSRGERLCFSPCTRPFPEPAFGEESGKWFSAWDGSQCLDSTSAGTVGQMEVLSKMTEETRSHERKK